MGQLITDKDLIDGEYEDVSEMQDELDAEMQKVVGEFGDENINVTKIKIYKTIPNQGEMEWLFNCTPNELPIMERLRDEYGGGQYEARLYAKGDNDKHPKLKRRFKINIGEPKKRPVIDNQNNDRMLTIMIEGFNKLGELIAAQSNQPVQQYDPMKIQENLLNQMVIFKQLFGDDKKTDNKPLLDQIKEIKEISGMIGGQETGANAIDGLIALANNVLPQLAKVGEQEQAQQAQKQRPPMAQNKMGQKPPLKPNPIPDRNIRPGPVQNKSNPIEGHINFLVAMAAKNGDVESYANLVMDHTPLNKIDELEQFLKKPEAIQVLTQINPEIKNYQPWFHELRQILLEFIEQEKETENTILTDIENDQLDGKSTLTDNEKPAIDTGDNENTEALKNIDESLNNVQQPDIPAPDNPDQNPIDGDSTG